MTRDKVFICYSHRDRRWLKRLQKMLKPLVRDGTVDVWADTAISAGADWRKEIESALASTQVAVLLVSADFIASDFITEKEVPVLLRAAQEEGVRILWVCLDWCHYQKTPIEGYQAAHDVSKPLKELRRPKQDRLIFEVSKRIEEAITESRAERCQEKGEPKPQAEAEAKHASGESTRKSSWPIWHVILVLDDSASMQGKRSKALNLGVERLIDEMKMHSGGVKSLFRISIIRFGTEGEIVFESMGEMEIDTYKAASGSGNSGTTNASAALDQARSILTRHPGEPHDLEPFLFFFSDGFPDNRQEALRVGNRIKSMTLPSGTPRLITVGIGDVNDQFMRQLATNRGGIARYRKFVTDLDITAFFSYICDTGKFGTSDALTADELEEALMEI